MSFRIAFFKGLGFFSSLVVSPLLVALAWKIVLGTSLAPDLRPVVALAVIREGCHFIVGTP
jgi:hypothetical protein